MQRFPGIVSRPPLPRLLVSVRSAAEARLAIEEGVQLIDVKEPRGGSLGAATPDTIGAVAKICGATIPLSVALGELLHTSPPQLPHGVAPTFIKCGLSGCGSRPQWSDVWCEQMQKYAASPVPVAYADWKTADAPSPAAVLEHAVDVGCHTILLDTFDKSRGHLLEQWTLEQTLAWITSLRQRGIRAVVAGSLRESMIVPLLVGGADCVAFRGAACREGRDGALDRVKLSRLVRAANSADLSAIASVTA